jgi:hypothetical protein
MLGVIPMLAWLGLLLSQEPDAALIRKLDAVEPGTRLDAVIELAEMGPSIEKWLHKKAHSGSAKRQRSLLLTAALLGTDESWDLLDSESRRGRKPDTKRAFALLLYGAYHPEAGKSAKADWKKASSGFEQSCLLAGLLAKEETIDLSGFHRLIDRNGSERQVALLALLDGLHGNPIQLNGDSGFIRGAQLLTTLLPDVEPLSKDQVRILGKDLPERWSLAALRSPGRTLDQLKGMPIGGTSGSVVFAMREAPVDQRQQIFDYLKTRVTEAPTANWLWGEAGDLGLDIRRPSNADLTAAEVAGLLRLALRNFPLAQEISGDRAGVARAALQGEQWPSKGMFEAVVVLALAGQQKDHDWFKQALETGTPHSRSQLQPLWLLANRKLDKGVARRQWLSDWSRQLGAGAVGFLDQEGPRWVALSLVANSLAAEEKEMLQGYSPEFQEKMDHPFTDEFYADLATFVTSAEFRFYLR